MKAAKQGICIALGALLAAGALSACAPKTAAGVNPLMGFTSYAYFGTSCIWAFSPASAEDTDAEEPTWNALKAMMGRTEESISDEYEQSSVHRFNLAAAGEEVELDATAYKLFVLAQEMYLQTEGAYNPAVGLLVDLWGFTPRFKAAPFVPELPYDRKTSDQLPDPVYLTAFSAPEMTDFSAVELSEREGKYYAVKPASASVVIPDAEGTEHTYTMQVNFGGIGKGYCVDEAEAIIRAAGHKYGYFNLGGSSMCMLQDPDAKDEARLWSIDVASPRNAVFERYLSVREADISLSSSGDYEEYYITDDVRYCHIVDGSTGYPVNAAPGGDGSGIITASVFGLTAAEGDATTTALMVMGREKAIAYITEHLEGKDVCFLYYDASADSYTMYTNMDASEYTLWADIAVSEI